MSRRSLYFVYQGLLTLVLLMFCFFERESIDRVAFRLAGLAAGLAGLMVFLGRAPDRWLSRSSVQGAWFLSNVLLTSLALLWVRQPASDLYLIYFLVIFGTAFSSNMTQCFLVAMLATGFYLISLVESANLRDIPPEFWLRVPFLWIAASFTAMLRQDARQEQNFQEKTYRERLLQMEGLAALGLLSGEIAHRIKAPLTTIRVNAEVLAHRPDVPFSMKGELTQIEQEVGHCKEILQKLLDLGRIEEMDKQPAEFKEILRSALETVQPQIEAAGIIVQRSSLDDPAPVFGDPTLLREAIVAVLQNAVEAMPNGGTLSIGLHWIKRGPWWAIRRRYADQLDLVIGDTGAGIASENREAIFRPLYTTKPGRGNGLGLSAALRILDKHGGTIRVSSDGIGRGARFTLSLPRSRTG